MTGQLPHATRDRRFGTRSALTIAVVMMMLFPVAAWASHQFSDVPDSHTFHDEISAVADAGIAEGYEDGTYRPARDVTRQAAAAFFARGGGHATSATVGEFGEVLVGDSDGEVSVLSMDVQVPGTSGGQQRVHLTASSSLFTNATRADACTEALCTVYLEIRHSSGREVGERALFRISGDQAGSTVTLSGLDTVPSGTTQTYEVVASTQNVAADQVHVQETNMEAVTVPMSANPT